MFSGCVKAPVDNVAQWCPIDGQHPITYPYSRPFGGAAVTDRLDDILRFASFDRRNQTGLMCKYR
jgi:hypothetical protein